MENYEQRQRTETNAKTISIQLPMEYRAGDQEYNMFLVIPWPFRASCTTLFCSESRAARHHSHILLSGIYQFNKTTQQVYIYQQKMRIFSPYLLNSHSQRISTISLLKARDLT